MPTASEFIKKQKDAGLDNKSCASVLGVSLSTIEKRRSGAVKVVSETFMALEYYIITKRGGGNGAP